MLNRRAAHTTIAEQTQKESDPNVAHRTRVVVKRETWPPVRRYRHKLIYFAFLIPFKTKNSTVSFRKIFLIFLNSIYLTQAIVFGPFLSQKFHLLAMGTRLIDDSTLVLLAL